MSSRIVNPGSRHRSFSYICGFEPGKFHRLENFASLCKAMLAVGIILCSGFAHAKWQMVLRADEFNPHLLPELSLMPNMDVACSDFAVGARYWQKTTDQVVSRQTVLAVDGTQRHSRAFGDGKILSQPQIISENQLLFSVNGLYKTYGIYELGQEGTRELPVSDQLMNSKSLTAPKPFADSFLVRRLRHDGVYELHLGQQKVLSEEDGYSHIHLPQVKGDFAVVKLSEGELDQSAAERGSYILALRWAEGELARHVVIASTALDPSSVFEDFDNSPQPFMESGVVFIGRHRIHGRGLFAYHPLSGLRSLVLESRDQLKLEYFAPNVNAHGDVVFRAKDSAGAGSARGVYWVNAFGKTPVVVKVLSEGEVLATNEPGDSRVIQRQGWPAFSGRPCVTDSRKLVIHTVLEAPDGSHNHGSAIFTMDLYQNLTTMGAGYAN